MLAGSEHDGQMKALWLWPVALGLAWRTKDLGR